MKTRLISVFSLLAFTLAAAAQVLISEIHYHPVEEPVFNADGTPFLQLTNDVHEFVEIQNTGVSTVDLGGWSLGGGISYTFPSNTTIASGAFRVIAKNPARLAVVYSLTASNLLGPYSGFLANGSDTVRVKNPAGDTQDAVTYDSLFPWAQSADALGAQDRFTGLTATNYQYKGRSLQRVSTTWASGDPANWVASPLTGPTPGTAQSATRTVPKPVVVAQSAVQVSDGATIVRSNQAVSVNCTYSSTTNLGSVTLEYFVDDINATNETRTSVVMTDLGSGSYAASIPGQTNRAIVRYRFKANRGDGLEVVSPRPDDPQLAAFGTSVTNVTREAWWGYFVTPVRTTTNAAIYDVFVSSAWLAIMSNNIVQNPKRVTAASAAGLPRDVPYVAATAPQWTGTVPGVFACDGKLYDIHIRYHGSRYHRAPNNYSYKLHFADHQPFNEQSSWFETLHGTEFIEATAMNRLLGLPASKMRRVSWYSNIYADTNSVHSEQGEYAGEMLDDYHDLQQQLNPGSDQEETGELYKDVGYRDSSTDNLEGPYAVGWIGPIAANAGWTQLQRYEWTYSLQNHGWKGPKPIRDLLEGMWTARGDSPTAATFTSNSATFAMTRAWFTNNWDVDELLTSMALLEWIGIWDDARHNQFYWRRANGQWGRLGWDYDGVMNPGSGQGGTNQTIYGAENGATTVFDGVNWWKDTFYKCFRSEYQKRLWELNNSFFEPTNLAAQGFTRAVIYANGRRAYVNTQLASLGTYYKPARPTNTYPANAASVLSQTNLLTSAYLHPQSTPHLATKWEIRAAGGNYEEPLLRTTTTNSSLTNYPIPFDQLTYGQTYYWRATHIDTNNHPSIVSAETSFTWGTSNTAAGTLVMNEILAYNRTTVQNGTDYPDYIELRNNGVTNITLTGYTLTDNPLNPTKYSFPSGTTINAGGYLLIWCDSDTNSSGLHSGFGLDSDGQTVVLMNGATIVDSVTFGVQAPDVAIGRIVNGTGGWQANTPTPGTANSARTLGSVSNLRINEWMADRAYADDWFEVYNPDSNAVSLASLWLSDTPSTPQITQLPALSFIAGNGYQKFWADGKSSGGNHANFKLGKSGENLVLTAANGATTIDTITFSAQTTDVSQGRFPDGSNNIVSFSAQTASPGFPNWVPAPVYMNEILAHGHPPLEDAVEIYNPTATNVSIGGWWLSDDRLNPKKYQIPAGTTVAAGGYVVLYEGSFNAGTIPFAFSAWGDEAVISAVNASGTLTGYGSFAKFGPSPRHQSFGRLPATGLDEDSNGAEYWALTDHTFGQDNPADEATFRTGAGLINAAPRIGPVVLNEVYYHPPDLGTNDNSQAEFIELYNIATTNVDLGGWKLRGDTGFVFPTNTTFAAGTHLLLVSFDPSTNAAVLAAFRATNGVSTNTPIYGPYSDKLANSTANLEITRPDILDNLAVNYLVDKLEYRDIAPWPTSADGGGKSLQRASFAVIGNTAANWNGATPTPGAVNVGVVIGVTITTTSPLPGGVVGVAYTNTFAASGGTAPYSWSILSGTVPGLTMASAGVFAGTPTTAASNTITVRVADSLGTATTNTFGIRIAATALALTNVSPLPGATLNTAYAQTLGATGGTAGYSWSLAGGSLPGGLSLNSAGVLSGTPTNHGAFNFTAQAVDAGNLTTTKAFALTVSPQTLVITTTTPMVGGSQNVSYSQALTGAGGITPYTWSLFSGSLPAGLSLSSAGDLSGTPTGAGTFNFTVKLTDSLGTNVTRALAVTIASPVLAITTLALADGTVGAVYADSLGASGGTSPYSWAVTWGALPGGLGLSSAGVVSGTPTNAGTFSFMVRVTDSTSTNVSQLYTIEITHSAPVLSAVGYGGGTFQLRVNGDTGSDYTIESSTNLVSWIEVFTTNSAVTPFNWNDTGAGNSSTFYRVRLNP